MEARVDFDISMNWFITNKVVRLVLALNVSFWMAGAACLFGCSNTASAGSERASESKIVVAGDSCASAHAHDCCAKNAPKRLRKATSSRPTVGLELSGLPSGMMKDCPLAVNGLAVISKASSDTIEAGVVQTASLIGLDNSITRLESVSHSPPLTHRYPTYLRCCVFLI